MKKTIFSMLISIFLIFCLASCGSVTDVNNGGGTIIDDPTSGDANNSGNTGDDNPVVEKKDFIITIMYNGGVMPISESEEIYVVWTNRNQEVKALVKDGIATTNNLDGEYNVHLSKCPTGYTYDPNATIVTSDNPEASIEMMKINKPKGKGTDIYGNIFKIENITIKDKNNVGEAYAYQASISKYVNAQEKGTVYYQFIPNSPGVYIIESIVDVNDDIINPIVDIYNGTSASKFFAESKDDGGTTKKGAYTKNFLYEVNISEEEIGNVFAFGIRAKTKDNSYPVTVYFRIIYKSFYEMEHEEVTVALANDVYYKRDNNGMLIYEVDDNGKLVNLEDEDVAYNYVKIGNRYPESSGSLISEYFNAIYTCVDNAGGSLHGIGGMNAYISGKPENERDKQYIRIRYRLENGKYIEDPDGEYVRVGTINTPDSSKTYINFSEYNQFKVNNRLVLNGNRMYYYKGDGYYHFRIGEIDNPSTDPIVCAKITKAPVFFDGGLNHIEDPGNAQLRLFGKENYKRFIEAEYTDMCNSDGVCYVTKELKDFLQKLSNSASYFFDGTGWCEKDNVFATEEDQWLFACGFYS